MSMEEVNFRNVSVLRDSYMLNKYRKHIEKNGGDMSFFFTSPSVKEWEHWRMIENDFPYNVLTKKHHMLTPKRLFANESEICDKERKELIEIKKEVVDDYDAIIENFVHQRTFKNHYHLHFISYKTTLSKEYRASRTGRFVTRRSAGKYKMKNNKIKHLFPRKK